MGDHCDFPYQCICESVLSTLFDVQSLKYIVHFLLHCTQFHDAIQPPSIFLLSSNFNDYHYYFCNCYHDRITHVTTTEVPPATTTKDAPANTITKATKGMDTTTIAATTVSMHSKSGKSSKHNKVKAHKVHKQPGVKVIKEDNGSVKLKSGKQV